MIDASDGDDPRNRPVELGVIKEQLRAFRGPKDVILVWQDAVIPDVAAFCYQHRLYRNEPMLDLARDGVIRFAVDDIEAVPDRWKAYAVPFSDLDDRTPCHVSKDLPNVYIWRAERGRTRADGRSPEGSGPWPEPAEGYRGLGSVRHGWVEIGEDLYSLRQLEREREREMSPAERPDRELSRISRGRLVLSRRFHHDQPPGEGAYWQLCFERDGKEIPIYSGSEATHDLKKIGEEIRANQGLIAGRMKALVRSQAREKQIQQPVLEQGL